MSPIPSDALFLGLDSSTQSLKAVIIDAGLRIHGSETVHFDTELPHYNTKGGAHRGLCGEGSVTAPPLMWVEALELVLDKLQKASFPLRKIRAISGSGQQHGSVYWKQGALKALKELKHSDSLVHQLQDAFSVNNSPIWMDSSTSDQCRAIETALGGALEVAKLTGSRAYERFTGPQIRKIFEKQPETYHITERISLVSSFMASLLIGDYADIDYADGAGMNLMDFRQRIWSDKALKATAPEVEKKLGPLAQSHAVSGVLNPFYVTRYGFGPECIVINWSGDNLCSLAGLALDHAGDIAISLGTSDTVFGITTRPQPALEGHIFPNSVDPASYMAMLCYKNGSLLREDFRDQYGNGSWETFDKLLQQTSPLNDGKIGFFYKYPEILPPLPAGFHYYIVPTKSNGLSHIERVSEFDAPAKAKALIEGQLLSMRAHAQRAGMPIPPNRIIATGGGSANKHILSLMASIFGCPVYTAERADSAALGAAFRAAHGWLCHKEDKFVPISTLFCGASEDSAIQFKISAFPASEDLHIRYDMLAATRMEIEKELITEYSSVTV